MKKFFVLVFCLFVFASNSVFAESLKAEALVDFSTENPVSSFKLITLDVIKSKKNNIDLPAKTIISGVVVKVESPKRGKRDSYFEIIPTSLVFEGVETPIDNSNLVAKISEYEPIDGQEMFFSVSRKVLNFMFKGLISAIEFVDGSLEAENGTRMKSGILKVYNDSIICYIEKGKNINIKEGDILVLKFKRLPN